MSRTFIVKESVFGEFGIESEVNLADIKIKCDSKIVRLYYSFQSDGTYSEVLDAATRNHLNLPDLVSATLGSRWTGFQIDLYERNQEKIELVGQIGDTFRKHQYRAPIFRDMKDAFYLFKRITQSQIKYNSRLRDVILTALSMAGIGGYQEIQHQWSWNAFEWFLRGLSDSTGFTPLLDYAGTFDSDGKNLREKFHNHMRRGITDFIQGVSDVEDNSKDKWKYDQETLQDLGKSYNIRPSIMEMYEQHVKFFKDLLADYSVVNDIALSEQLTNDSDNIDDFRDIVMDAKDARDGFVHTSNFQWKRTGLSNIDGVSTFRAFSSVLLLIAMTNQPESFDTKASRLEIIDLPDTFKGIPPTRVPVEGTIKKQVRNNGDIETESAEITIANWDYTKRELKISCKPKNKLKVLQSNNPCIYPYIPSKRADCEVSTPEINFTGSIDYDRLHEGILIKVYRWCYE